MASKIAKCYLKWLAKFLFHTLEQKLNFSRLTKVCITKKLATKFWKICQHAKYECRYQGIRAYLYFAKFHQISRNFVKFWNILSKSKKLLRSTFNRKPWPNSLIWNIYVHTRHTGTRPKYMLLIVSCTGTVLTNIVGTTSHKCLYITYLRQWISLILSLCLKSECLKFFCSFTFFIYKFPKLSVTQMATIGFLGFARKMFF